MSTLFKQILAYICILLLFSILYFACFQLPINFAIFTYKGLFFIFVISFILLITLILLKHFCLKFISIKDIIIVILLFTSIHLFVFCMVPVTIERSFSVFMLSEISKQDGQKISLEDTKKLFTEKYVTTNSAFSKRFQEQIITGTLVEKEPNIYMLTYKGNFVVSLFNFFDKLYNVNSTLLK